MTRRISAYIGMVNINGKAHSWSSHAKVADCGAGAFAGKAYGEVDITDRGREEVGGLCRSCWPVLPSEEKAL